MDFLRAHFERLVESEARAATGTEESGLYIERYEKKVFQVDV
jgi:hypothetical protein